MGLIKNPITNQGEIRYVEIIKVFIFVMFLFALYSMKIQNISGFDAAFTVTSSILVLFIGVAFSFSLYKECMSIYNQIVALVAGWMSKEQATWQFPRFTIILKLKETIQYIKTIQTQSIYCVFQC